MTFHSGSFGKLKLVTMKIKTLLIPIFILTSATHVIAQTPSTENITLQGKVLDKETNLPLAYVSVGVLSKSQGTVADTLGQFAFLITNENVSDSLQFSIVGYKSLRVAVKDFISNADKSIKLRVNVTQLSGVIVTSSNLRSNTEIIGRQGSGKLTQISIHHKTSVIETVGSEMGMLYKTNKENAILKDFNFYVSANNFNYVKYRVNIYSLKNGLPDSLMYNKQIFATVDNFKTGWTKINLERYNVRVANEFVVTVQWIESRMDKKENPITIVPFAVSPFSKNCFARIASQDKWIRKGMSLSNFITIAY